MGTPFRVPPLVTDGHAVPRPQYMCHSIQALCICMLLTPCVSLLVEDHVLEYIVQAFGKRREREQLLDTLTARLAHALCALPANMATKPKLSTIK